MVEREQSEKDRRKWIRAAEDRAVFGALFREHAPGMFRSAFSVLRNEEESWDVVQESFLKILEKPERYAGRGSMRNFLFRVARNAALDRLRRTRVRATGGDPEELPSGSRPVLDSLIGDEDSARLLGLVERLKPLEREILRLRFEEELDYDGIGRILGKRAGTVRVAVNRSKAKLSKWLEEMES